MKTILAVSAVLLAAISLSACKTTSTSTDAGQKSEVKFVDLDGDGKVTEGEKVLQSYAKTFAGASGAPASAAQALQNGIQGYGAGTSTGASTVSQGAFLVGDIKASSTEMTITIDGKKRTIPAFQSSSNQPTSGTFTQGGNTYSFALYAPGEDVTTVVNGNTTTTYHDLSGDSAVQITLDYAALSLFIKNYKAHHSSGSSSYYTYDGFSMIASGLQTPEGGLPTSIVEYKGTWFLISGAESTGTSASNVGGTSGTFTATLNFATKALTQLTAVDANLQAVFAGTGKITGDTFQSNVTGSAFDGEIVGGVYGPHAEEIAGIGNGTSGSDPAVVGLIGEQQP